MLIYKITNFMYLKIFLLIIEIFLKNLAKKKFINIQNFVLNWNLYCFRMFIIQTKFKFINWHKKKINKKTIINQKKNNKDIINFNTNI